MSIRKPVDYDTAVREALAAMQLGEGAFFAFILYERMNIVADESVPIAATDGRRVLLNPVAFSRLTAPERVFVLAHEVLHVLLSHVQRFARYRVTGLGDAPFDHELANIAADYIINRVLVNSHVGQYKSTWLLAPDRDLPAHADDPRAVGASEAFEAVYLRLLEQRQQGQQGQEQGQQGQEQGQQGQEQGQQGQEQGQQGQEQGRGRKQASQKGFDSVLPPPSGADPDAMEREMALAAAAALAATKAVGKLPGALESFVREALRGRVDWRKELRLAVTQRAGAHARSWTRPDRRQLVLRGQFWPARMSYGCDPLAIVVDTSGSVSDRELQVFLGEMCKLVDDLRPREVHVLWTDATVHRVDVVRSSAELRALAVDRGVPGRGGTDMRAGLRHVLERIRPRPAATLVLTDGHIPWPAPGEFRALAPVWVITSPRAGLGTVPDNVGRFVWLSLDQY